MLLDTYQNEGLLFYKNFLQETPKAGLFGYRGDLVLIPGEVGDDKGHTKPPQEILREAVLLADDKLLMVLGGLDKVSSLTTFVEKYKSGFAPDMKAIIYIVNLKDPVQVSIEGITFVLIPLVQGVPWNETMEELCMEKGDFKGQSPAEKLLTLFEELKKYQPKYPSATLEDAMATVTNAKRETHGAL